MTELYRFAAFISYSSKDAAFARRLHRALETYRVPRQLGAFDLIGGGKPNRVYPVFRDREELPSGELGAQIEAALKASNALIVVCSPHAAASPWVNAEVETFLRLGRRDRIFAIIANDAPILDASGADATLLSFPHAFRGEGLAQDRSFEPIAADARPGKDGFRNAWLKIVAGLVGANAGALQDRDRKRRRAVARAATAAGLLAGLTLTAAVGIVRERTDRLTWQGLSNAAAQGPSSHEAATLAVAGLGPRRAIIPGADAPAQDIAARAGLRLRLLAVLKQTLQHDVSADGRRVLFKGLDGNHYLFDRTRIEAGVLRSLGELRASAMTPDGAWIIAQDWKGALLRFGAEDAPDILGAMDLATTFELRGARTLLAETDAGDVRLIDINTKVSAQMRLKGGAYRVEVSRDGASAIVSDRVGSLHHVDLVTGAHRIIRPLPEHWEISPDGRALFIREPDRTYRAVDARTGAALAFAPADQIEFDLGGSGRYAILKRAGGEELVRTDGRSMMRFPEGASVTFDYSGTNLRQTIGARTLVFAPLTPETSPAELTAGERWRDATAFFEGAEYSAYAGISEHLVFRLAKSTDAIDRLDLRTGAVTSFGVYGDLDPYEPFDIASGGTRLLLRPNLGVRQVLDLETRQTAPIIRHQDRARAAPTFAAIALVSPDLVLSVWDGSGPIRVGDLSPEEICRASPGLAPLSAAQRDRLHLQGRPWNPCDWRGLLAIAPDPASGDGWFEGPRQFFKRLAVRYFRSPDYRCEDGPSAAGDELRDWRRRTCAYARDVRRVAVTR